MRGTAWAGATVALAAVPLAVLAMLVVTGALAVGPALAAAALVGVGALALAAQWAQDLEQLAAALDRAQATPAAPAPTETGTSGQGALLPAVAALITRIERLARTQGLRTAELGAALRANEAIIEHLPDPLLLLDAQGAVQRTNAAARAAFGAEIAAVLRHPMLREAIDRAGREAAPQTADLILPVPVEREVQATVMRLEAGLAGGARLLVVLSDRTRERAVERMRADFVANASHELRTPLTSLVGFVETLQGPAADDPPAQQRFLAIMAEQAGRMNRLIDDLLSLSRVELTEHTPPADSVDLGALLGRVLVGFEVRLRERGTKLEAAIAPDLPKVVADADQVVQVMGNLVDNAIKYGREGGTVRVSLQAEPPGARFAPRPGVLLVVRDEGPGIPRAHLPRLTERFYRVDKGRSRNAGGTGLGLAIVKHIVNRHRGRLAIDSEEGQGSIFSVWLPLTPET